MRASALSVLLSTLLSFHQASAGLVRTTDVTNAEVDSFSDAVFVLDNAVASSKTDDTGGAVEPKSLHRRYYVQLQALGALADFLTQVPLRADCFFVTSARLLGTTVEDISNRAGVAVPRPGTSGVSMSNMMAALERLGLLFHVNAGRPYRSYIDYQANPRGVDVTRDVRRSSIFAYFAVDLEASSGQLFDQQLETIEAMDIEEEQAHVNEPMDTDEYAGVEAPMDVDRDVASGGVDLNTLPENVLQRIRNNLLPQGECAALVALAMIHASSHRGPRVMPGFEQTNNTMVQAEITKVVARGEDKCKKLQAMIPKEKLEHGSNAIVHDELK
ncbi:hypothetical protein HRG_004555 [Hirsutella rhossiliensis]|uniref:Uncharacterized protein n=1 Tax=Hirsutella rhossiliensis TaxID=111463 RepID=A0A9P8MZF5_9HYPO|nr:uncharacterized protein HRG_04555 [Hirsutella rhossiliensis]KAH0964127.1 hypothetical protein HRG_04555 [Hirsutella rhossiliensis]